MVTRVLLNSSRSHGYIHNSICRCGWVKNTYAVFENMKLKTNRQIISISLLFALKLFSNIFAEIIRITVWISLVQFKNCNLFCTVIHVSVTYIVNDGLYINIDEFYKNCQERHLKLSLVNFKISNIHCPFFSLIINILS